MKKRYLELEAQINELGKEINTYTKHWAESICLYKIGDIVKIPTTERHGSKLMRVEEMDIRKGVIGGFYLYMYGRVQKTKGGDTKYKAKIRGVVQ